jgi:molecular chaperone Hsp33
MHADYVQRFLFEQLAIRGRLVCLGGAWTRMLEGRAYAPEIVELLGHTTALAVLLGANQKDAGRVTLQIQGSGPVRLLVADCTADLRIRGMAQYAGTSAGDAREAIGEGRIALSLEDLASGRIYQSLVPVEGRTMSEIFVNFLARSEQRPAHLVLHADRRALCGLMLEKLPGADERDPAGWARVTRLASRLALADTVERQPYDVLVGLFGEELLRVFRLYPVEYHCPWNPQSVERVLRTLGRSEVESILAEQGAVVVRNEMCNHEYRFDREAVEAVFG